MDYFKIYQKNYEVYFELFKVKFYTFLNNAIEDEKQFDYASELLIRKIYEIACLEKGFSVIQNSRTRENIIQRSDRMYQTDGLRKVINNELEKGFEDIQIKNNYIFDDYKEFLISHSCQDAYFDYLKKTEDEKKIINTLYELNEIEVYDFEKQIDYASVIKDYNLTFNNLYPADKKSSQTPLDPNLLSKSDTFLIVHVLILILKNNKKKISTIEIARVFAITNIDNEKLLTDKYKNVDGYKILSNGLDKLDNDISKIEWIKNILIKIEPYKLEKIKVELKLLLRNLELKQK